MRLSKSFMRGKTFNVLLTSKGMTIEDIPKLREEVITNSHGEPVKETADAFVYINSGAFVRKPVRYRETRGTLECHASYALFVADPQDKREGVRSFRVDYSGMAVDSANNRLDTEYSQLTIFDIQH